MPTKLSQEIVYRVSSLSKMPINFTPDSSYLSSEALSNLKYYKYAAVDKSCISYYILRPYWEWATTLFPLWMAPNLITLTGFFFVLLNLVLVIVYVPDLKQEAPSWVYLSFATGIWLYSTFDNVDGKQARRTKSSSPLGELFDHGCDALNCSIGGIVQAAALGLGHSWYTVFLVYFVAIIPFYFSTWEEYHTGILYLGYINGPTEGLLIGIVMSLITAYTGPQFWHHPVGELFGDNLPDFIPSDFAIVQFAIIAMAILILMFHVPMCMWGVYQACRSKNIRYRTAVSRLFPLVCCTACTYAWLSSPYSSALKDHIILFSLTGGIAFGRIATKIILAHVTRTEFPQFTVLLLPLIVGAAIVNLPRVTAMPVIFDSITEGYYIWTYFIFAVIAYLHWAYVVITKFCDHLKIQCFKIPYRKPKRKSM